MTSKNIDAPLQKAISLSPGSAAVYNSSIAQLCSSRRPIKWTTALMRSAMRRQRPQSTPTTAGDGTRWVSHMLISIRTTQANSALRQAFALFKAKGDQNAMQAVDKQYTSLNGANNSLMTGQGVNEKTNQPGQGGNYQGGGS